MKIETQIKRLKDLIEFLKRVDKRRLYNPRYDQWCSGTFIKTKGKNGQCDPYFLYLHNKNKIEFTDDENDIDFKADCGQFLINEYFFNNPDELDVIIPYQLPFKKFMAELHSYLGNLLLKYKVDNL